MKDIRRKCAKCNLSSANDPDLIMQRFPNPGLHNLQRVALWAKFCYPEENWESIEFQKKLHDTRKMLCSAHFPDTAFVLDLATNKKKFHRFSLPSEASDAS